MKKVSVILPTYNEKDVILDVIRALKNNIRNPLEIIVVDDDSPDRTWLVVKKAKIANVKVIRRIASRGLASAISHGVNSASGDIIAWMDADMCHPPELVPKLIKATEEYDIVIASRYVENGKDARPFIRRTLSKMINIFANIILNFKILDWTTGFVVVRKEVFKKVKLITDGYGQYCIHFLYSCTKEKFKIKEIGFVFVDRTKGKSKTHESLWGMLNFGYDYVKEVVGLKLRFRGY